MDCCSGHSSVEAFRSCYLKVIKASSFPLRGDVQQTAQHQPGSRLSSTTAEVTFPADGPGPHLWTWEQGVPNWDKQSQTVSLSGTGRDAEREACCFSVCNSLQFTMQFQLAIPYFLSWSHTQCGFCTVEQFFSVDAPQWWANWFLYERPDSAFRHIQCFQWSEMGVAGVPRNNWWRIRHRYKAQRAVLSSPQCLWVKMRKTFTPLTASKFLLIVILILPFLLLPKLLILWVRTAQLFPTISATALLYKKPETRAILALL